MAQCDRGFYEAWSGCQPHSRLKVEEAIRSSHEDPSTFWKELFSLHEEITGLKNRSIDLQTYDLYHDCVTRHLGKRRCAVKLMKDGVLTAWTYEQLDRLVNFQSDRWVNAEIKSGVHVAIVMPVGIHFIVTLLTALRMGLKFTFLPLDSPALSPKRIWDYLDQINPDLIMTTSNDAAFINQSSDTLRAKVDKASLFSGGQSKKCQYWLIDYLEEKGEAKAKLDFVASNRDIAQVAIASQSAVVGEMRAVTVQEMFRSALRDGCLMLGLKPGVNWGYSSYCPLREQPSCLIASLFNGATTLYFSDQDLEQNPQLLENEPIEVLHISPLMKNRMMEGRGFPKHKLKLCTRSLFDDEDERSWDVFKEKCKLEKTPFSRIYWDASQSGISLFSIPSIDKYEVGLWPALGVSWELLQLNELREKALEPFGILQQIAPVQTWAPYSSSNLIVTVQKNGCFIANTVSPTKDGYTFPMRQVQEVVSLFECVDKSILLNFRTSGGAFEAKLILMIFVKSTQAAEIEKQTKAWTLQIVMKIKEVLGPLFVPDRVEFYPFSPKLEGDEVDRQWCELQYQTGMFARKRKMKVYQLLNHLRTLVKEGM